MYSRTHMFMCVKLCILHTNNFFFLSCLCLRNWCLWSDTTYLIVTFSVSELTEQPNIFAVFSSHLVVPTAVYNEWIHLIC